MATFRTLRRRRVILNLKTSDRAFLGVLWAKRGPLIVLKNASLSEPGGEPVPVDGEVVVERSNVEFYQVLGEA